MPRATLRHLLLSVILALAAALSSPSKAEDAPAAFQNTIRHQLDAFLADDFAAAFGDAAPFIQNIFRTPENFGMMVRNGYPMVWRPGEVRFLEMHERDGKPWQKVMITDQQGAVHILDYEMVPTADGLRIGGVEVLRQPEVGA